MAEMTNLESILATLAAQKPADSNTPPGGVAPGTAPYAPPASAYPQPTTSGSLNLNAPAAGTVSIQEAIARAKAHAAQNGVASYDRPITYAPPAAAAPPPPSGPSDGRRYRSSRSRSPPPARRGGNDYRENHNPYRDERRDERRDRDRDYGGDGGGGRGRPYSPATHHGDRHNDSFSPRGAHGGGRRDRSPRRDDGGGGGGNVEIIEVQAGLVGLIIGRQGENLRRIEGETQCRVQFLAPDNPADAMRQCKITGQPPNRADARSQIMKIIEESGSSDGPGGRGGPGGGRFGGPGGPRGGPRGGGPGAPQITPGEGEEVIQIMIPDRTVGLIIGRGGETIRDLQERSGCHINIVDESNSVSGLRPVNLIGGRAETTHAKELIMEIVDSDTRNGGPGGPGGGGPGGPGGPPFRHGGGGGYGGGPGGGGGGGYGGGGGGDRVNDSMFVPAEAVGMIIGKGGETIREMQSTTGCKINVSQTPGANENEREIGLIGSREAIERAKISIEEKVEAVRQKNSGGGYGGPGGGRGRGRDGGDGGGYRQQRDYDNGGGYGGRGGNDGAGRGGGGGGYGGGYGGGPGGPGGPGGAPAAPGQPASDDPNADPYAAYGGYAAYVALWYQALAQQQGGAGGAGAPPPAPGQ